MVIDDSEFYNKLMTSQIRNYLRLLESENNCAFELHSFLSYSEFLKNEKAFFDIAVIDFYLNHGIVGTKVLEKIKGVNDNCKSIVVSQERSEETVVKAKREGFDEFVHKEDRFSLPRVCFFIEQAMNEKMRA